MYERFTDRARKVMQLANQEAQRFNHEYIGTEHILIGFLREGTGVAANVLRNLHFDLRVVRLEVEKLVPTRTDDVSMGKLPLQTPLAKKVIEFAIEESVNLNHRYVGTEHLLLGLLRVEEGIASQVLKNFDVKLETVRQAVLTTLGEAKGTDADEPVSLLRPSSPPMAIIDPIQDKSPAGFLVIPSPEAWEALERFKLIQLGTKTVTEAIAAALQAELFMGGLVEVRELETLPEPPKPKPDVPLHQRPM